MFLAILQTLCDTLDGWYALNSPRLGLSPLERTMHPLQSVECQSITTVSLITSDIQYFEVYTVMLENSKH
jgi:hypothetical protein